jgi:hypothetical protein
MPRGNGTGPRGMGPGTGRGLGGCTVKKSGPTGTPGTPRYDYTGLLQQIINLGFGLVRTLRGQSKGSSPGKRQGGQNARGDFS